MGNDSLLADLGSLRDALRAVELPLALDGVDGAAVTRDEAIAQIEDYLLPRLSDLDAPLLAVLGGSTGAGKSTLTNSLVGANVSIAGVLRPTTRSPVLVHHPDDAAWFAGDGVLPDIPRATGERPMGYALHLVHSANLPRGFALLDSPDIDSIEVANHDMAKQLLGAADLWMFVTTAARYADAVPWSVLTKASERAAAVALIVNRVPPTADDSALQAIGADVRRMLDEQGLSYAELFLLEELPLVDGRLPDTAGPLREWLEGLVADADARAEVIRSTVQGAVSSLVPRSERLVAAMRAQLDVTTALHRVAHVEKAAAVDHVDRQLGSGVLLRGEVLDRFREQVGTAAWMDSLQRGVGRLRDRITSVFTGSGAPVDAARGRLADNLVSLIDDAAATSIEKTIAAWSALPGGRQAVTGADQTDKDVERLQQGVERWQDDVVALVRQQAEGKIATARGLSLGVNGIGVTLMTLLFASTGGLTGGEVAVAGGTAAVSQTLLTAVLGEQAVRALTMSARKGLLEVVDTEVGVRHAALAAHLRTLPGVAVLEDLQAAISRIDA